MSSAPAPVSSAVPAREKKNLKCAFYSYVEKVQQPRATPCNIFIHIIMLRTSTTLLHPGAHQVSVIFKIIILAEAMKVIYSLCHHIHTGSRAHTAFYPMDKQGPFPQGEKWPGFEADHSPPSSDEVKNL
jgi:hypothetical protein